MNKEDKSFLLFTTGIMVVFFGYIFRGIEALIVGLWILAINQWFVFYKKNKKKKFYLLNYKLEWSTIKTLFEIIKNEQPYCWHSEELSNKK